MAPPFLATASKTKRLMKLIAFAWFLYQLRKFIRKLRALSDPKHTQLRYRDPMMTPSARLFPQYFESSTKSGLWIFHRDWVIPNFVKLQLNLSRPRGVVIISHGLAEHIQRYEPLAQQLNKHGFACYGMDHQGHGMSDGDRCYVEKFEHYVNDLLYFSQGVCEQYAEYQIPVFLLGHSMGGLIASWTALKSQESEKGQMFSGGVILSSPFFGVAPEADIGSQYEIVDRSLRFISRTMPKLRCIALDNKALSHDPKILYRLQRDILHHTDMVCMRTVQELVDAASKMITVESKKVEYPYLIFGGASDGICNASKWKVFDEGTRSEDKEFTVFDGLFHECLNETEPQQKNVTKKVIEWLERRCEVFQAGAQPTAANGNVAAPKSSDEAHDDESHDGEAHEHPFDD